MGVVGCVRGGVLGEGQGWFGIGCVRLGAVLCGAVRCGREGREWERVGCGEWVCVHSVYRECLS